MPKIAAQLGKSKFFLECNNENDEKLCLNIMDFLDFQTISKLVISMLMNYNENIYSSHKLI